MKLNEVNYAQPLMKKGLSNLMQFFVEEDNEYHVKPPFVVRNSRLDDSEGEIRCVEFAYEEEAEANDLILVTYKDGDQDDMPKKEFVKWMSVYETRQLY